MLVLGSENMDVIQVAVERFSLNLHCLQARVGSMLGDG